MSRIGRKPISVPESVSVEIKDNDINVKGPLGNIKKSFKPGFAFHMQDNIIRLQQLKEGKFYKALYGLYRSLLFNMIKGVHSGFEKKLILSGVGYKVLQSKDQENTLIFNLGYSHPIEYAISPLIEVTISDNGTKLSLKSHDNEILGETAARIRKLRPPEPYKKKGIRYENEVIITKSGKASKK